MQCICILKGKDAIKLQVLKFLDNTMENRHLTLTTGSTLSWLEWVTQSVKTNQQYKKCKAHSLIPLWPFNFILFQGHRPQTSNHREAVLPIYKRKCAHNSDTCTK